MSEPNGRSSDGSNVIPFRRKDTYTDFLEAQKALRESLVRFIDAHHFLDACTAQMDGKLGEPFLSELQALLARCRTLQQEVEALANRPVLVAG